MRVIAGRYNRRILIAPSGQDVTRPTSDRVKESLFNILAFDLEGKSVLDLFAGTGALGIEALSRGAKHAVFVENNKQALKALQKNLESLQVPSSDFIVVPKSVNDFLSSPRKMREKFDFVFADPPYNSDWSQGALQRLEDSGYCSDTCLFMIEKRVIFKSRSETPVVESHPENWALQDTRKYGKTQIEFWRRKNDQIVNGTA